MDLSKIEVIVITSFISLTVLLFGSWLLKYCMEIHIIFSAIGLCFIGALLIVWHNIYRTRSSLAVSGNNNAVEETKDTVFKIPLPECLKGEDAIKYYNLSRDLLRQYVRNGLPIYPPGDRVLDLGDEVLPLSEEELAFEEENEDYSNYRFKKADIEKYIKDNT
jgi:hypothetical protein